MMQAEGRRAMADDLRAAEQAKRNRAESQRVLNCVPSPEQDDDWGTTEVRAAGFLATATALPDSVDLREDWWKVGDQRNSGSCVGWATADSLLRWHFVKAGRLAADEQLSARFLWMAAKETDEITRRPTTFIEVEGTSLKAALKIAGKYGAVRDRDLPFATGRLYRQSAKRFYVLASHFRVRRYVNLGRTLADWRSWLANEGPVAVRLDVDDTWREAGATKGVLDEYHPTTDTGHAAALVGYDRHRFIVRNSWGTDWGDEGFGYASIAYARAAFTEAYGVNL